MYWSPSLNDPLLGLLIKKRICSHWEQVLSFKCSPQILFLNRKDLNAKEIISFLSECAALVKKIEKTNEKGQQNTKLSFHQFRWLLHFHMVSK